MNGIVEGLVFPAEEIESPANLDQVEADETSVSITPFGECIRVEGALDLSGVVSVKAFEADESGNVHSCSSANL